MQIAFQNRRSDFEAFYNYMLKQTEEGKQLGKRAFRTRQYWSILLLALLYALVWGILSNLGLRLGLSLLISLGLFLGSPAVGEVFLLLISEFKPYYFSGIRILKRAEKLLSEKDIRIFQLSRTFTADNE